MDGTTARVGEGDITITLDGKEERLVPSFMAAQTISRMHGGIRGTIEKIMQLDVDAICQVVAIGMGYMGNKRAPDGLQDKIWRSGFADDNGGIVAQLALYCRVLANGGRMPKESDEEDRPTKGRGAESA